MLKVNQMLGQMRQRQGAGRPKPFSLLFVTANRSKRTGGSIRYLSQATLVAVKNGYVTIQPVGTTEMVNVGKMLILTFNDQPVK